MLRVCSYRVLTAVAAAVLSVSAEASVIGVNLGPGNGSATNNGTVADPSLHLTLGGWAQLDVNVPTTGVQHVGYDISIAGTDDPTAPGSYFSDWLGLLYGQGQLYSNRVHPDYGGIGWILDAAAANSAPGNRVNAADYRLKVGGTWSTGYSVPATYHFDFALDYNNSTTTFTMSSGLTPIASNTWNSVFTCNAVDFSSTPWTYGGNGAIIDINNVTTSVPEPGSMSLFAIGAAASVLRRRGSK